MSEYMSQTLEPVARRMDSMEINATGGLLNVVNNINNDLKPKKVSSHEGENDPQQRREDQPDILPQGSRLNTTPAVPVLEKSRPK